MAERIDRGTVVTIAYELRDVDGALLDEEGATVAYLHGGYGGIFPKVEDALEGHGTGPRGDPHPRARRTPSATTTRTCCASSRARPFPTSCRRACASRACPARVPSEDLRVYTVTGIADDKVVVDGNHPLAGERVWFHCTVPGGPAGHGRGASPRPRARRARAGERGGLAARLSPASLGSTRNSSASFGSTVTRTQPTCGLPKVSRRRALSTGLAASVAERPVDAVACACRRARTAPACASRAAPAATCARAAGRRPFRGVSDPRVGLRRRSRARGARAPRRGGSRARARRGWPPSGSACSASFAASKPRLSLLPTTCIVAKTTPLFVQRRFSGMPGQRHVVPLALGAFVLARERQARAPERPRVAEEDLAQLREALERIHPAVGLAAAVRPVVVAGREDQRVRRGLRGAPSRPRRARRCRASRRPP